MIDFAIFFAFIVGLLVGHFRLIDFEYIRMISNIAILERKYVIYCEIYPKRGNVLKHNCIITMPIMINQIDYEAILKRVRIALIPAIKPEDPTYLSDSTIIIVSMNSLN